MLGRLDGHFQEFVVPFPTQDVFPPSLSLRNPSLSKRRKVFREWQPQSFVTPFLLWFGQWTKNRKKVFRFLKSLSEEFQVFQDQE